MATPATPPTPEIPTTPVACPSCGSKYNPATRELVDDTKLREKIAALESDLLTLRGANAGITRELEAANAKIVELSTPPVPPNPEPRRRGSDFRIGGDD